MIAERYTDYMYGLVDDVMKTIGARGSCSEEERRLGRRFASEIEGACGKVETEKFTCSPNAFVGFFPLLVLAYLCGVVLYFFLPPLSCVIALAAAVVLFLETVRYKEFIDPAYPKKEGENVAGFIEPRGEAKKRVYVSAHFDSAYEFKIWYWFKNASSVVMGLGFLAVVLMFAFGLASSIAKPVGPPDSTTFMVLGYILVGFSPLVAIFFFFHTKDLVGGAMDDLTGIAVLAGLARYLGDAKDAGEFYPQNTEVVLLGLSSEEAGLRGAKRYSARHAADDEQIPCSGIFLDGICDESYFTVFNKEVWMGALMDPGLVALTVESARSLGFDIATGVLPLGATDASAFAQAGIPSVSLCLQINKKLAPNYHTRLDTIEFVKPSSMTVALATVIEMLRRIDETAVVKASQ